MPEHDARAAARDRDTGMAKITAITWRAGAAGVAVAGLLTVALSHHADTPRAGHGPSTHGQSTIVIPAQPPQPAAGSGQVTSGAS
jgi:hypothetical protein